MTRVALITEQVKPGGKRSHVDALAAGLEAIGWSVSLVDWHRFSLAERAWIAGPGRLLNGTGRARGVRWMATSYAARAAAHLRALRRRHADLRVANLQEPFVVPAARRAVPGLPIVLTIHGPAHRELASGYDLPLDDPAVRWLERIEREAFLAADALVSVDRAHADYARAFGRRDRLWVIPNFVDTRRFHPAIAPVEPAAAVRERIAGRSVVLCPRLLVAKNGVHVAVEALKELLDRGARAALVVAGDGPERAALEALAERLGVAHAVCFLGAVPTADMPGWYRRADVVVVPSVSSKGVEEATSISALEAQACGRPVVASALGGLREIIEPDVTGVLVTPGRAELFASAIGELLADPERASRLARAAVEHVRANHSHEVAARRYEQVYRDVSGGPPAPRG